MNVAYQFYKLSKGEYFVLSSFLPYLEKEEAKARKSAGEREEVPEDPFASGFAPEKEREAKGGAGGLSGSEWPEDTRAEIERPPSKKSWLSRLLFGRRERHKKTAKEELRRKRGRIPCGTAMRGSWIRKVPGKPCILRIWNGNRKAGRPPAWRKREAAGAFRSESSP